MMNDYKKGFGRAVRAHREECGLTKERLALMVGINRLTLRRIEAGDANPTLDVIQRIAKGLDTPLSELMAEAEADKGTPSI
ncbi:helix-turn-helix domain-containing protein [Eggerthella sinensis]|uniref:helix-turn-helix domain-containing protein n=1 Tax=Eggerthella sinensis TaxID=242230 RepID=UPI001D075B5A|nr:helix-turn-helix transcriptional regulator [Eggerthella sinensis]MCB7037896.1 helix-turn-helix domain-containing protein [Eggerthella sinensis]